MPTQATSSPSLPSPRRVWLVPNITLALFVVAVILLLAFLHRHETELQRNNLLRDVQWAESSIARKLLAHQEFIDGLARAVAESDGEISVELAAQVEDHLRVSPELRNLVWNLPDASVRWWAPGARPFTQLVRERPAAAEIDRMERLTAAMSRATYTHAYRDYTGEPFIEYHSPILRRDGFYGTVSATYSLRNVLQNLVPTALLGKYRVALVDGEARELFSLSRDGTADELLTQSVVMSLPWRDLSLSATSYQTDSLLAQTTFAALTLLLSAVLVWSLWSLRKHIGMRMAADQAARASHERFVTVLDALDAAVYVADLDSDEILFVNENFHHLFPGNGVGDNAVHVEQVLAPMPIDTFPKRELLASDGEPVGVLKEEVENIGTGQWFLVRVKAIRWVDGRLVRLHMCSDITDRKIAEDVSRQQQEKLLLTSRLMTVGEMASTLAHEINQPLTAIANYCMGCVRRLRSGNWRADELLAAMEKASVQAERAGRVVQRVREFVRRREPHRELSDINAIVRDVAQLAELDAEREDIRIELDLAGDLPPVIADRIMVEQVVLNLVKNAIESMRDTPPHARELVIATTINADGEAEVSVRDAGHGIGAEAERELFAPFFTTKPQGMGIGLNICRSIIELHEGRLWFTRNGDRGSTFRFTLPAESRAGVLEMEG